MQRPNAKALVSVSMPALASLNSLARSIIRLRAGNPLLLNYHMLGFGVVREQGSRLFFWLDF
jgi:hypothetical protein